MAVDAFRLTYNGDWADLIPIADVFDHDKGPDCMCGPSQRTSIDDVTVYLHVRLATEVVNG